MRSVPKLPGLARATKRKERQKLAIIADAPVFQDHHDVIVEAILRVLDDQRADEPPPHLFGGVAMRVEKERTGIRWHKAVVERLTRLHRQLREIRHAIHRVRPAYAMPVDGCVLCKLVPQMDV